jgi:membrane associated rhomboid family serine protease
MLCLPYRAKNPPERLPYATITLISLNVIVFLLTIDTSFEIRQDVLDQYGVSHNTLSFSRLFTALFLHENIMHIAGNMLFFWIFGASVEGRIGWWRFLFLYFFAGIGGGLLHDLMMGAGQPDLPSLGASGAIMGLGGAYLYLFPYSTICIFVCFFSWFYRRIGVVEWQARWVVLLYIGLDVFEAFVFRGTDGVGQFAHKTIPMPRRHGRTRGI